MRLLVASVRAHPCPTGTPGHRQRTVSRRSDGRTQNPGLPGTEGLLEEETLLLLTVPLARGPSGHRRGSDIVQSPLTPVAHFCGCRGPGRALPLTCDHLLTCKSRTRFVVGQAAEPRLPTPKCMPLTNRCKLRLIRRPLCKLATSPDPQRACWGAP